MTQPAVSTLWILSSLVVVFGTLVPSGDETDPRHSPQVHCGYIVQENFLNDSIARRVQKETATLPSLLLSPGQTRGYGNNQLIRNDFHIRLLLNNNASPPLEGDNEFVDFVDDFLEDSDSALIDNDAPFTVLTNLDDNLAHALVPHPSSALSTLLHNFIKVIGIIEATHSSTNCLGVSSQQLVSVDWSNPEFMLALFPGNGSHYVTHRDAPPGSHENQSRLITVIYYINIDWKSSNGGFLRLYSSPESFNECEICDESPDHYVDISPSFNRLVLFNSRVVAHEVRSTFRPRWAVTAWFRIKHA